MAMKLHRIILAFVGSGLLGIAGLALGQKDIAPQQINDVAINEVAWGGTDAYYADEWIELYNNTAMSISLAGWHVTTADGMNLALHGEIAPYGYYLIERSNDQTIRDIAADWVGPFGGNGLLNTGETVTLTDSSGLAADTANGDGGSWPAGTTDATMERVDSRVRY